MSIRKYARLTPKGREMLIDRLGRKDHPCDVLVPRRSACARSIIGASGPVRLAFVPSRTDFMPGLKGMPEASKYRME